MARKKIHVTAEEIANGIRSTRTDCPIALALTRESDKKVRVNQKSWSIREYNCRLPIAAVRFIDAFDDEVIVESFAFYTDVPDG